MYIISYYIALQVLLIQLIIKNMVIYFNMLLYIDKSVLYPLCDVMISVNIYI